MAGTALLERLTPQPRVVWRAATVTGVRDESPRARSIFLEVPGWPGQNAGQHVDLRLTAEDGYVRPHRRRPVRLRCPGCGAVALRVGTGADSLTVVLSGAFRVELETG